MAITPANQLLPVPAASAAGRNNLDPGGEKSFAKRARLYQPANTNLEPPAATVSRFTLQLIDRLTGEAFSADELLTRIGINDDGDLTARGIVFADTGNVSIDEGVISQNAAGNIIKHDGISDGDDLPYLEYAWRLSGYQEITAGQNQAGVNRELGRITIPASLATAGRDILVIGSFSVEHGGTTNIPAYVLGFVPAGVAMAGDVGVGYINNVTNQAQTMPTFRMVMSLLGVTTYSLTPDSTPLGLLISGNSSGNATLNTSQVAYGGNLSEEGPIGASHDLILYYSCGATASAPASKITVNFRIYAL